MTENEIDLIDPTPVEIKLSTGVVVSLERLRTRQFFKLLKILTRGAGSMLMEVKLNVEMPQEEFVGKLIGLIILSVPEAEDEAIEFLKAMTLPVGLASGRTLSSVDKARNDELWASYHQSLRNPELDDMVSIFEQIVRTEAADIQRLGKRILSFMKVAEKTGQLTPDTKNITPTESSEDSLELSISSPPSTDGATNE